jgi:hypothetical protein
VTDNARVLLIVGAVAALEIFELVAIRREGDETFALKLGWQLYYSLFFAASVVVTIDSVVKSPRDAHDPPLWVGLLILGVVLLLRPQPVVTSSQGLAAYRFWGLRRRFIPWGDVSSVASNWQEQKVKFWTFTGYDVALTGRDGTQIAHTIYLRKRSQFLDDLRKYLPPVVFSPGLYDWHP